VKVIAPLDAAREAVAARPERPATAIVHDAPDARVVVFRVGPEQAVPPHTSRSTVLATVVAGEGVFTGADGERALGPGTVVAYEPSEPHGWRATGGELVVMAVIAPRPGA
jgi:quercetin dioxygenase-like cupin family protein